MFRLLRVIPGVLPLAASLAVPAFAQAPVQLLPNVTYEKQVQFTPHGPVAISVITGPAPTGLYTVAPVLGGGTVSGTRQTLTQLERDAAVGATTAGINGDFFNSSNGQPVGLVVQAGAMTRGPSAARSSIGFDSNGTMHVARFSFNGTWQGAGQRRPLAAVNQKPQRNQVVLFTSAWGAATPALSSSAAVALFDTFPAAGVNKDISAPVTVTPDPGQILIPTGGAVLVATGTAATKLQADAPVGTNVTVRLNLPSSWASVVSGVGGGPLLVRGGKAVFHTNENFDAGQLTAHDARAGVGQLADGRVVLVAVDGGRPGYSVGMTTYELAQTMVRLGCVTAAGLQYGKYVTAAFDGQLLNRPSDQGGERAVKEGLLFEYFGVYAPPPSVPVVTRRGSAASEQLSYRLLRPSNVTAAVVGPNGTSHQIDTGAKQPGTYTFTWAAFDSEGAWHWNVQATDDLGRVSTADRSFSYDLTLSSVKVSAAVTASAGLKAGVTLARPASVSVQIVTAGGVLVATVPAVQLQAGAQSVTWNGKTTSGGSAPAGSYLARISAVSAIGTVTTSAPFRLHR